MRHANGVCLVPNPKSHLLLPALLAAGLGGCTSISNLSLSGKGDVLSSEDYNYFYRREAAAPGPVSQADLVGPDGRCEPSPAFPPPAAARSAGEQVAQAPASEPINPRSNQAL